ncbi:carboxypeptidase-like protein [Lutibacter sp. Hel_I_33_5]|uniref:DUF5686 and carboxypeptidase regulatory-like domain-containing protein n=1 Tax=Lutibacter sp. Hel_I_33_5 TaxID=1566289 RepID=UPI0011A46E15|nr:DUF5686 and carboxypeptidase regulatory-like domain-containing protein [Lutibacter sp. Hel_I_33_5]TVZ56533.1 carboxypeptidase-like protein [Lutibacter sp. Hel_I_33_5]
MKKITLLFCILNSFLTFSQVKGKVTDTKNKSLSFVNIYLENSLTGTSSNDNGEYLLAINKKGKHTIVFQFLGYKTFKKTINIQKFPHQLNVKLEEEQMMLDEISITSGENPAIKIIRNVISSKEKNTNNLSKYTADFYSRGLFKIKDAPKKILGQELGDLGGGLDSTRSGIIYLSETVSKITSLKKPKKFKEIIVASKVSGRDNGISFNQAAEVNFNLYENQVLIAESKLFSPISDYAFSYYNYKLTGSFYDKEKRLINKIELIPKRKNDRVFGGFLYVVEDSWAIYGSDLTATGAQIGNPGIDVLHIKQNYNFDHKTTSWPLILQTIDFKVGALGFYLNGRFSAAYSNYNFNPTFTDKTFGNEILAFEENATKKDAAYWNNLRSVPLTKEETNDYKLKDSIKTIRKSKKYLDSVDSKRNRFKITSPILGYTKRNTFEKKWFNYSGIIDNLGFNTVQGFNTTVNFNFFKRKNDKGNWWTIGSDIGYGLSDKKIRPVLYFTKKWNSITKDRLGISGGNTIQQFDARNPISNRDNSIYSVFYKRNFAKFYEKTFAKIYFSKDIANGVYLYSSLEYANRKPLTNTTDYSFFKKDRVYQTNNPLNPISTAAIFNPHKIITAEVSTRINFGNKYLSYPNFRANISNTKYPILILGYRKAFGTSNSNLNHDIVFTRIYQNVSLSNFGEFKYNTRGGIFLQQKNIAFMDYYHPLGNEIDFAPENRMSSFNLLPYYTFSTNDKYAEMHVGHNFKGFILGKVPLLNKLNFHVVGGTKALFSGGRKPYTEYSIGIDNIGWGKWRFLRVDYVRSNFGGVKNDGFLFGISL